MIIALLLLGALTLALAASAVFLRNLVHAALCLAATLAGLAGVYLLLGAQFIGLAQVLIYIGAVAVIILFAVLLTRGGEPKPQRILSPGWVSGLLIAALLLVLFCTVYASSDLLPPAQTSVTAVHSFRPASVREIGLILMGRHALSLQVIGLLLTASLMGAVLLATRNKQPGRGSLPPGGGDS